MKKRILLTLGDPNGIGPEIILKILGSRIFKNTFIKAIGSRGIFDFYSKKLKINKINAENLIHISGYDTFKPVPGKASRLAGRISGDSIRLASELCLYDEYNAMITMPISKESLNAGGYDFPGHTEMLTYYSGSIDTLMIMYSPELIVANATNHIPLSRISRIINKSFIKKKIISFNNILVRELGVIKPTIAVLSFNPHNGDGGALGNEEQRYFLPAINELKNDGLSVFGTFAADSYFANKTYKKFDATLAVYHDQGLTPFKMLSGKKGVNYTGGLKIVRTSPDHGTAFDIAGKGLADISSSIAAVKLALKIINS